MSLVPSAPDEPPVIPDHRLTRIIGRGSYGEVWLAHSALGTARAVKVVRRATFDSDRPFIREFSGIQKFEPVSRSHDGLIDILHVGRSPDGSLFYSVMELADPADANPDQEYDPRTMAADLERHGARPVRDLLPIFLNLAGAVAHLHERGLLHRDIKPANVIFVSGVAKLADIGLVTEAGESRTYVGTEGFVPPEGPGTQSADLFALGKLMYETATGRDRHDFPSLPVTRGDPAGNRELLELNAVLVKCCDPRPDQRYRTATELQADLALLQSGQSVHQLRTVRARLRFISRASAAGITITLLATFGWWLSDRGYRRSEQLRARAETAEKLATDRLYSALLARASAERRAGDIGARASALESLRQAAELRPDAVELRTEAIAALTLPDFRLLRRRPSVHRGMSSQCFSPDLSLFASASAQGTVEVRSTADDRLVGSFPAHAPKPNWIGPISASGSRLCVLWPDGIAQVWDIRRFQLVSEWTTNPDINTRCFVAGEDAIMETSPDAGLRRIDLSFKPPVQTALTAAFGPSTMAPNPAADQVAIGWTRTNLVQLLQASDGRVVRELRNPGNVSTWSIAWSPDGRRLALAGSDRRIRVWSLLPGTNLLTAEFSGHVAEIHALAWNAWDGMLASSSWDGTTRLWSLRDQREIARVLEWGWGLVAASNPSRLGQVDGRDSDLLLYEASFQQVCRTLPMAGPADFKITGPAEFSSDGRWIFAHGWQSIRAYRTSDGMLATEITIPGRCVPACWPYPGEAAYSDPEGYHIVPWQVDSRGLLEFEARRLVPIEQLPHAIAARGIRETIVTRMGPNLAVLTTNSPPLLVLQESAGAGTVTSSVDGNWVAGSQHGSLIVWDAKTGAARHTVPDLPHARAVFAHDRPTLFHVNGMDLVAIDLAQHRELWRTRLSDSFRTLGGLAVSPDNRLIAAFQERFAFHLVDATTGRILAHVQHPDALPIVGLTFSPDLHYLAATCESRVVQLWDLARLRAELSTFRLDW